MSRVSKYKQHLAKIVLLLVEGIKCYKDIKQIKKNKAFQIQQKEKDDFCDKYMSNHIRDSSSNKFSFNEKGEKTDNNKRHKKRQ